MFHAVALAGASALGMGALLSVSLLDFTGILGASALAATGLCIIPYRRVTVKREFDKKIDNLRERLMGALQTHFDDELHNSCTKIRDAISPFSTYVQKQERHYKEHSVKLDELVEQTKTLQDKIHKLK